MKWKNMGVVFVCSLFAAMVQSSLSTANVLYAPHDGANGLSCSNCHSQSIESYPDRDAICELCHYPGGTAPYMQTHAYKVQTENIQCSDKCSGPNRESCIDDTDCPYGESCLPSNDDCPGTCSISTDIRCKIRPSWDSSGPHADCPQQNKCSITKTQNCTDDNDCPVGETCYLNPSETCEPVEVCLSSSGKRCSITDTISCDNDIDCPTNETCGDYYRFCSAYVQTDPTIAFKRDCVECHNPHFQVQLANFQTNGFYLATGLIDGGSIIDNTTTSTFTFDYSVATVDSEWTLPETDWGAKTKTNIDPLNGRGLILVINPSNPGETFEIASVVDASPPLKLVTVNGSMPTNLAGQNLEFGVIYGQMINTEGDNGSVVFTGPDTFGDNDSCTQPGFCSITTTQPCTDDGDCPGGETCQVGFCSQVPAIECAADGDCPSGETCSPGKCSQPPFDSCTASNQCGPGAVCRDRFCTESYNAPCNDNSDCPSRCSITNSIICSSDLDCPQRNTCSVTITQACAYDAECPPGETCNLLPSESCGEETCQPDCSGTDPTPDGVCQACHVNTDLWRSDGTSNKPHKTRYKCTDCHLHSKAFREGGGDYKHDRHRRLIPGNENECIICHGDYSAPYFADGQDLMNTEVCEQCHYNGRTTCGFSDCQINDDCTVEGEICRYDRCMVSCVDDIDCDTGAGEVCADSVCQVSCLDDTDCGSGERCLGDICTETCQADSDCDTGEVCMSSRCYQSCTSDTECVNPGELCIGEICFEPCPPNVDPITYKNGWKNPGFKMNCTGCHSGELKWKDTPDSHLDDFIFIRNANNWEDCVPCHSGATTESCATCAPGVVCCADCHDGAGPGSQTDLQWIPVGPRTNGHPRLASSEWIRHYECWTCHFKTQDTTRELTPRHSNGRRDITIDPKWNISDARPPYYDPTTQVCGNTYCHSDGRDVEPVTKGYPWGGGHKDCNACHSHDPDEAGTCVECHAYDKSDFGDVTGATQSYVDRVVDTDKSWTDNQWKGDIVKMTSGANVGKARLITSNTSDTLFIGFVFFNKIENGDTYDIILAEDEKKWSLEEEWLSAMPMYEDSTGNNPNSHFRHLFTGFSCDDCHADTVVGACVSCHDGNNWPEGDMNELAHVNGYNHVDKKKTVRFKDGGTYWSEGDAEHAERSCSGTVCHVGRDPVWGGSVDEDVVCKECHGSSVGDTDDFGKFNDIRAKIDLNQWENTGHGRPALDAQGNPNTNYPSDNPPANFPENGCWYCHDAEVLHMDEERPFRLIQHDHFNKRFEKECVFCHMVEDLNNPGHYKEDQCLVCHNDATGETLAPQLDNTPNNHAKTSDPLARMNVCSNCHRECQYETDCLVGEFCTTRDGLGTVCTETENPEIVDHYDCASCHTQPYPTIWTEPDHREFNQSGTVGGMASCSSTGCHDSNENRHNVGVEVFWTQDEVDDAQNAYLQMGVCLKCHDDDAGDQCNACHLPPNDDPSTPFIDESQKYELGYDPFWDNPDLTTVGRIKPVKAKAASFHFGHLHEDAFKDSLLASPLDTGTVFISTNDPCADDTECTQADEICGVANTCVSTKIVTSRTLTDRAAGWTEDAFIGRRAVLVKAAGPFAGEERSRPIVRNTADTIIVAPPFFTDEEVAQSQPGEAVSQDGDSYQILDVVWKGGKFCWDCHDPHGDDNIYMIQNEIATRTDGVVGKPLERARTFFDDTSTGTAYALTEPRETTQKYDGICNVCHTAGQHYTNTNGDGHNASRPCTQCHEHRFTNSHASGQSCDTCHANRPVPRHTAFGQARDCTKCHTGIINNRMNIMTQFRTAKSHHVQTVDAQGNPTEPTNKHCYACHWEATPEGVIDPKYHEGYDYRDNTTVTDAKVDLVIWSAEEEPGVDNEPTVGGRPTVYDLDGSITGTPTATTFLASNISLNSGDAAADLVAQRGEVDSITGHCLGCHSDKNNDTEPFNLVDHNNGDCKTPRQYAWDGSSVDSRYSDNGTTTWGKYADGRCSINKSEHCEIDSDCPGFDNGEICNTYPSTARKEVTKAFSAHGNAVSGGGGFDPAAGLDGPVPNTRAGLDDLGNPNRNFNVQCYDCHSSHGSRVTGRTSSYVTFNGTYNGGNLKETQGGYGGYPSAYKASANLDPASINPYAAGAGQCFDCHESAAINTQVGSNSYTPWGYLDTFGATAPVMGYRDSNKFGDGPRGVTDRFPYKQATIMGGHLKASSPVPDPGGDRPLINGLCTPCHDPHGLSDTLSDEKKHYAVPLLKGTWMTSPYREDVAIAETTTFSNQRGRFVGTPPPMHRTDNPQADPAVPDPEGRLPGSWRTDRNTFNQEDLSVRANRPAGYDRITEDAEFFAGLCLTCHPKSSLTSDADTVPTENLTWAQKERIHRSVKGWGVAEGAEEREHSFTCSKCHAAHVSGLPRLMKTNCLNYKHRGRVIEGGPNPGGNRFGYFPNGWWDAGEGPIYGNTRTCHGEPSASGATNWPDNQSWNSVTPWEGGQ